MVVGVISCLGTLGGLFIGFIIVVKEDNNG